MTEAKPAEFAKGDKVTNQDGLQLVVVNQSSPGGAVQAETAPGVKPYRCTFYAADSLKKATRKKKTEEPTPTGDYIVTFRTSDDVTYTIAVEGGLADPDDAIATAQDDDSYTEGDEVVSVEKVDA